LDLTGIVGDPLHQPVEDAPTQRRYPNTDPEQFGARRWRVVRRCREFSANQVREELSTVTLGLHRQRDDKAM
jgi:hypothetical protein